MRRKLNIPFAIRLCRAAADLTQHEMSTSTSISTSHLSMIERGKRQPSLEALNAIIERLGIPPEWFYLLASGPEAIDEAPGTCVHIMQWLQRGGRVPQRRAS